MTHPSPPICDKTALTLCRKIQEAIRKAGRPLRRGELAVTILDSEPRMLAACRYGIENGLLVRHGHYNNARYDLPQDSDPAGVQQERKEVP